MAKVLIAPAPLVGVDGVFLRVLRDAGFEIAFPPAGEPAHRRRTARISCAASSAAIAGSEPYTRRVLQAHPQLRVIARAGVGYDAVDTAAATELGMAVTIAPGTNQDSVAEHTFAA